MHLRTVVSSLTTRSPRRRLLAKLCVSALVLAAILVSVVSLALAVTTSFPDVPSSHPYYAAITNLASRSIIGGYANGYFGPGDDVTRQQFAKMIVLTGGYPVSEANVCFFTDVEKGDASTLYPDNYIAVAAARGITTGKTATTFDPSGKITRYQVVSMVVRTADNLQPGLLTAPPAGWTGTGAWPNDSTHGANAARAEYNGLLAGLNLSALSPSGNMNRGEVAQVLHNLLGKLTPATTTTTAASTTTTTVASVGYESQGGVCAPNSGPAVASWGVGRLDVFVRGADNALWHKAYDGSWSTWNKIGGVITSDPAAVSWGPNRIDVFARGVNDHLWHIAWTGSSWSPWEDLGGILTSGPAVCSPAPNMLAVVVRSAGNGLYTRIWTGTAWSGWVALGGVSASDPAIVAQGLNSIDVFATGFDYALYHAHWNGAAWSTLESLGGICASGPGVASWAPGRLDVFVRGPLGNLWTKALVSGTWSGWVALPGTGVFVGDPDAVSWGPNRIDLFAVGADYGLWHKAWTGAAWVP